MIEATMRRACAIVVAFGVGLGVSVGCDPQGGTTVTPTTGGGNTVDPGPEGNQEDGSMGALEIRLQRHLREQAKFSKMASSDPATCEKLCGIATNICRVSEDICKIADRHASDQSYQNTCREARQECTESEQSCVRCVQAHGADKAK